MPFTVVYYFPVFLPAYFQCLFDLFQSFTSLHYNRPIPVPAGLRRGPTVARLLELRVRILPWHGCVSVVNDVCCQVEFSETGRSLVQNSTECVMLLNKIEDPHSGGIDPLELLNHILILFHWLRQEPGSLCFTSSAFFPTQCT